MSDDIKNAATHLMGEGHVDEGVAVEALQKEVLRLRALVAGQKPVCPHCLSPMVATKFKGYYDQFDYWACSCDSLPCMNTEYGAFG